MVFPHGGSNIFLLVNSQCIRDGCKQKLLGHLSGLCNSCRDAVGRLTFLGAMIFVVVPLNKILLMEEILHQLRVVFYPIIFMALYIPGG